jgi:glycosyltransferase involved in cell wall biosynthesis
MNAVDNFKIAFFLPSLVAGGAERVTVNLVCTFVERGYPVQLLLAQAKGEFLADLPAGVPIRDLGQAHVIRALPALRHILRAERPDILLSAQTHANLVALWAAKLARVQTKVIVKETSTMSVNAALSSPKDIVLTRLARIFYPAADAIVAPSKGAAEDLARTINIRLDKIKVIYNPTVSQTLLEKAHQLPNHPWMAPGSPPLVLAVGRLTAAKDYPTLLRAFARARQQQDLHLLILGEGKKRSELETLVRALGLEHDVQMPGFVPNPYAYMARASVFVLSSAVEGFPNVIAEALACGTPVVSTDCKSGPAEILDYGRYGALVPVGDDAKLSREILKVINSQPDKSILRRRGEIYSVERAAEAYLALFRSLLSEKA